MYRAKYDKRRDLNNPTSETAALPGDAGQFVSYHLILLQMWVSL